MSKGLSLRRRAIDRIDLPVGEGLLRPLPSIEPTPHERVRETLRVAREILPRDLTPITRFFATCDLFRGQER